MKSTTSRLIKELEGLLTSLIEDAGTGSIDVVEVGSEGLGVLEELVEDLSEEEAGK